MSFENASLWLKIDSVALTLYGVSTASMGTGNSQSKIFNANGNPELRAIRRPTFDVWKENGVQVKGQNFIMNPHAYNSLFKSGRKDIMPDDIITALSTKATPGNPGSVVYTNPYTGTKVYVNPTTKEKVGVQPGSFKD
ncbi:hypothetical protein M2108_006369 [Paenibacillus sp. PastM-3]|uniref:hypothetical protein n=1 Tax=unclassified Paenibacillus TaxID=185978 RepID=UPI002404E9F8|nr:MULTISPECIES: hypothetical protein [unclassified Paenibacillus]MDF9852107.1 hypothetical protein [Paenibacillus sp. PastM-2]MDH6511331.1 hypothetical protein [Paenibacillus sp. PastM-3]